ncbi:hypothetical protein PoB_006526000 [Plakobranchus ocellatus]|uniref:Uncharacterized protein n=1 Tax=Plakobranchus ocellatus TaxID=259542 RepID=A0AAV4D3P0_9GAST|nr:hypothetical protein PoB_006526000 [Plakobranchus ocellatus]
MYVVGGSMASKRAPIICRDLSVMCSCLAPRNVGNVELDKLALASFCTDPLSRMAQRRQSQLYLKRPHESRSHGLVLETDGLLEEVMDSKQEITILRRNGQLDRVIRDYIKSPAWAWTLPPREEEEKERSGGVGGCDGGGGSVSSTRSDGSGCDSSSSRSTNTSNSGICSSSSSRSNSSSNSNCSSIGRSSSNNSRSSSSGISNTSSFLTSSNGSSSNITVEFLTL